MLEVDTMQDQMTSNSSPRVWQTKVWWMMHSLVFRTSDSQVLVALTLAPCTTAVDFPEKYTVHLQLNMSDKLTA